MTVLSVSVPQAHAPPYRLALLGTLLLATAVIADPSDKLVLPPDSVDSLSDRIYDDAGTVWRPEPTPDYQWREPAREKPSRIQWGYDSVHDTPRPAERPNIFSTGPESSGPRPATLFRWSF